jgi:hypothetical protein
VSIETIELLSSDDKVAWRELRKALEEVEIPVEA